MEKTYNYKSLEGKQWAIKLTQEVKDYLKPLKELTGYYYDNIGEYYHFTGRHRGNYSADKTLRPGFEVLTLDELKQMIDPTITGWKLKDESKQYEKAVASILGWWWEENSAYNLKRYGWHFSTCEDSDSCEQLLKKAGVLEQWFEPIYKQEKITSYKVGDYLFCKKDFAMRDDPKDVRYKEGKVYLSESNRCLTDEVGNTNHVMGPEGTYGINGGEFNDYFRFATEEEIKTYRRTVFSATIGTNGTALKITDGKLIAEGIKVNINQVVQAYNVFKTSSVGEWSTSVPYIQIGCGQFTQEELKLVIEAYNEISGTTFKL